MNFSPAETESKGARKPAVVWVRVLWTAILLPIVTLLVWSIAIEPNTLRVQEYTVYPPNWPQPLDGMRVAIISDLHAGSLYIGKDKIQEVVARTNAARPDVILLLGDFICTTGGYCHERPETFAPWLATLRSSNNGGGVYSVLGNHDWWYDGKSVRAALERAHIRVLENEAVEVHFNNHSLWLVGVADKWTRTVQIFRTVAKVPDGDPMILMSHNPDVFPDVPASVNLTVAGHTHGGQVSIPGLGPLVVPSRFGARYAQGLIEENEKQMFVTQGIGTSMFPIRFMVPPEISILVLKSRATLAQPK